MNIYGLRAERPPSLPPRPVSSLVCFLRTLLELCTFTAILISIFYIQVATLLLLAYSELRLEFRRGSIVYFPSKNAERNILLKVVRNCLKLVYKFILYAGNILILGIVESMNIGTLPPKICHCKTKNTLNILLSFVDFHI